MILLLHGMDDYICTSQCVEMLPPLAKAAAKGDLQKIKKLIQKGKLPQTPDNRGWTAIHSCVAESQLEALKLILKLKSRNKNYLVNLATWEHVTPLLIAMRVPKPSVKIVRILLRAGANPKRHTFTSLTPLHVVCTKKRVVDIVKLLVKHGADVNAQEDLTSSTPLHFAVSEGCDLPVVKFLMNLTDLSLTNSSNRTILSEACNANFFEGVEVLLKKDKNLISDKSDIPPIVYACHVGNLKMVELLLNCGADVNCRCKALLSCKSTDSDVILLDKDIFLPLHSSITDIEVFKFILKLTKTENLLQLESNYSSFALFMVIYADEPFFQLILQSNLPARLKTINCQALFQYLISYHDMEDVIIKKLPLMFKYNFDLDPENFFEQVFSKMPENALQRNLDLLYLVAQLGVSSAAQYQNKSTIINLLETSLREGNFHKIKPTCDKLLQSVLTLKEYSRIALRHHIKSYTESDWLAVRMVRESNLPECLKNFILFESLK